MFCLQCLFKKKFHCSQSMRTFQPSHTNSHKILKCTVSFLHPWIGSWYFPCLECLDYHSCIPANLNSTFLNPRPTSDEVPRLFQLSAISFLQIPTVVLFLNPPCTILNFHVFRYTFNFSHQITGHLREKSNLLSLFILGI